jgi:hypothetical protein
MLMLFYGKAEAYYGPQYAPSTWYSFSTLQARLPICPRAMGAMASNALIAMQYLFACHCATATLKQSSELDRGNGIRL